MTARRILLAFVAGFLATLVFHQGGLALLNAAGLTDRAPFGTAATEPLGVPQFLSLAFWGGVWGVVLAAVMRGKVRYLPAFIFGAVAPTIVAFFVVAPLKDMPIAGGGDPKVIAGAVILNGLWGLGTALFLRLFHR
ncbi:MAG: hypothetical protein ACT4O1_01090 [Gemmatimonadota bacterium]